MKGIHRELRFRCSGRFTRFRIGASWLKSSTDEIGFFDFTLHLLFWDCNWTYKWDARTRIERGVAKGSIVSDEALKR